MDASKDRSPSFAKAGRLSWIGGFITACWLAGLVVYLIVSWPKVSGLEPNELGDFLAGAFAPLAFFWLVLGFFQQGAELRNSGEALWLQGEELRNSVEQQRDLVSVTREQLAFESSRLTQERVEMWRKSQPDFYLSKAGSAQSGTSIKQTFSLANHGRPCTRVNMDFGGRRSEIKFEVMPSGERQVFRISADTSTEEQIELTVTYLDEMLRPGFSKFRIGGTFPGVDIEKLPVEADAA